MGVKKILVAEDDIDDQQFLTEAFDSLDSDLQVRFINSGEKVLPRLAEMTDSELPHLILLDYNLPQMNGHQVLTALAAQPRLAGIIKVVWTTSASPVYEIACKEAGASAYFIKPVHLNSIKTLAAQMVELIPANQDDL